MTGYSNAIAQLARLREVCESYGLPTDVDGLVRHVTGNVGITNYLDGINDTTEGLRHVGWVDVSPDDGSVLDIRSLGNTTSEPGLLRRPVFTHDDWTDKVPNTERNQRG